MCTWGSRDDGRLWCVVGCEQPSEFVSSSKLLQFHAMNGPQKIDPAPKFNWWILRKDGTLRCFTAVISFVSQDMGGSSQNCGSESGMSLVKSSVWRSYSEPMAAACGCLEAFYLNFICVLMNLISVYLFLFLHSLFVSLSLDWDFDRSTGAMSLDGSLESPKMNIKIQTGRRK